MSEEGPELDWLEDDPFPELKTRDLLHMVVQGVMSGKEHLEAKLESTKSPQEEADLVRKCVDLIEKNQTKLKLRFPEKQYYQYYWALLSTALLSHEIRGELGAAPPEKNTVLEVKYKITHPFNPLGESASEEARSLISQQKFGDLLSGVNKFGHEMIPTYSQLDVTIAEALRYYDLAHEDASTALTQITKYISKDSSPGNPQ